MVCLCVCVCVCAMLVSGEAQMGRVGSRRVSQRGSGEAQVGRVGSRRVERGSGEAQARLRWVEQGSGEAQARLRRVEWVELGLSIDHWTVLV